MEPGSSVSPAEALALINDGALLIDVREDEEWAEVRAPHAQLIPMSRFTQQEADELPTDRTIVCMCHLGGRSANVTAALVRAGLNVVNLDGGMDAWQAAGLPVVRGDAPAAN